MACINPNSPEFKEILLKVNNPLLAEIEMDKSITTDEEVSNNNTSSINNPTIQEAISWIKSVMPDANIELVNELVDDIGIGSYDTIKDLITLSEKYANKRTAKHEVFHKSFNSLSKEKQEELLEEGSKLFGIPRGESKVIVKYSKVEQKSIDYMLKSVDILQSAKAIQTFEKGNKNKWNLDKILTELSIPKEQKQLIIDLDKTNREEIITDLLAIYSYTIEINTAKKDHTDEGDDSIEHNDLNVPGGTNYKINVFKTPLIIPSIINHFFHKNQIGWFRSDEQISKHEDKFSWAIEEETGEKLGSKTRRILEVQSDLFQKGRDKDYLVNNYDYTPGDRKFYVTYEGKEYKVGTMGGMTRVVIYKDKDAPEVYVNPSQQWLNVEEIPQGLKDKVSKEFEKIKQEVLTQNKQNPQNQFLQLLNKDNNWVTFFVKSIIQDSAKQTISETVSFNIDDEIEFLQKEGTLKIEC